MKKIIFYLLFTTNFLLFFSQTRNDVVNINNPNLKLLDSLLFEEAMKQRKLNNAKPIKKDIICELSAEYQSEYMAEYNVFDHFNTQKFKGVFLEGVSDRVNHFIKARKTKVKYLTRYEIITMVEDIYTNNYKGLKNRTYQELSEVLINAYMVSTLHRITLLLDYKKGEFNDKYEMRCDFKAKRNPKNNSIFVTGVYLCVLVK